MDSLSSYQELLKEKKALELKLAETEAILSAINVLALKISQTENIKQAYTVILEYLCTKNGWEIGETWLIIDKKLQRITSWHIDTPTINAFDNSSNHISFELGQGLPSKLWESKLPLWFEDVKKEPIFMRKMLVQDHHIRSAMGIPVLVDNEVVAVNLFFNRAIRYRDETLIHLFASVGNIIGTYILHKQTEEQLREKDKFITHITETVPDIIYVYDLVEGKNIYSNHEITEILGYTPDEVQAMGDNLLTNIIHPDDMPMVVESNKKYDSLDDNETMTIEYRVKHKSGDWRWIRGHTRVFLRDNNGQAIQNLGIAHDITKEHNMQQELQIKHNELENFFSLSLDLLCIADSEGHFRKLSPSWSVLGYSVDELIGKQFLDFVHPDDMQATLDTMDELGVGKPVLNFINRYQCKDTSYRFIEWRAQQYDNRIYAVAHDITKRKKAEESLKESELRYRSVVTTMSEGIVLHAQDGSIEACNKAAEEVLGLTADQMMGHKSIDPLWHVIHEDGSPFPGETHPAMVTLRTGKPVSNVVMGVHKPSGGLTWILVNTQPIFHEDTDKPSVVASFTDITQMKQISEALRQSESRFRTISEMISDYTYGFSVLENGALQHEWTAGAFESITGYTSDEMNKRGGWGSIFYPEDLLIAAKRFKTLLSGKESVDEFRIITKSGQLRWIQDYGKPIWDEKEGVLFIFLGRHKTSPSEKTPKNRL
ncbi:MAG: PAS domain S-box protein [bacterium]|nr:PAS domain S-box protein [bacterium]